MRQSPVVAQLLTLLNFAHLLRQMLSSRALELTGLTLHQVLILCEIDMSGGRAAISDLAAALSRASHTITAMVNTLETRGLVAHQRDRGVTAAASG